MSYRSLKHPPWKLPPHSAIRHSVFCYHLLNHYKGIWNRIDKHIFQNTSFSRGIWTHYLKYTMPSTSFSHCILNPLFIVQDNVGVNFVQQTVELDIYHTQHSMKANSHSTSETITGWEMLITRICTSHKFIIIQTSWPPYFRGLDNII